METIIYTFQSKTFSHHKNDKKKELNYKQQYAHLQQNKSKQHNLKSSTELIDS